MKRLIFRFARLFIGYFISAAGMVMTINANVGLSPWDVLNQGIGKILDMPIGRASIISGFVIIIIDIILGQNIGWGTVLNMIFIGIFIDLIMFNNWLPIFDNIVLRYFSIFLGIFILGYGCMLYIGAGFGIGPRDGLMVALTKRTNKSVRLVKNSVEILALTLGYFLGGTVGIGTALMAISGGYLFQIAFKTVDFDVTSVEHRLILDDIKYLKEKLQNNRG